MRNSGAGKRLKKFKSAFAAGRNLLRLLPIPSRRAPSVPGSGL